MTAVEQVAAAILYEGYLLWPYRRSATKNRWRFPFGGIYPRAFGHGEPWYQQMECLVIGDRARVEVAVRFLHLVDRRAAGAVGGFVDELRVGGERYLAGQEATERVVRLEALA